MFAVALLCTLLAQEPKVSVDTGGAPIEAILKDLSTQSKVPLRAADRVRGDILIVKAKDVPLKELMGHIAEADGAEWKPNGDGFELTRSTALADAQLAKENALRAASLKRDLDEKLESALAPLQGKALQQADPEARLAWRAMAALGPSTLARVQNGTRIVFSTDPNPAQKMWPGSFGPIAQTYFKESSQIPRAPGLNEGVSVNGSTLGRVVVAVSLSIFEGYTVHVYLYNQEGSLVADGKASLMAGDLAAFEKMMMPGAPTAKGQPLELSPTAKEFVTIAAGAMGQQPVAISPELRAKILDPAKYDPLSFFVADGLGTLARQSKRSLVAVVPDFAFLTGLFLAKGGVTEGSFRSWLGGQCEIDESTAGWMTVRPRLPVEVRTLRVDRAKMGAFYQKAWKNGGVRLSDLGAYVATQPRRYTETISLFYAFFCMPEIAQMFTPDSLGALRTYGQMTDAQRVRLEKGEVISLAEMTPEARAEVADWIFNGDAFSSVTYGEGSQYVDVTDAFPNGLALPCGIRAEVNSSDAVIPLYNGKETLDGDPFSASSLGFELGRQDAGEARTKAVINGYRLGQQVSITLQFESLKCQRQGRLAETRFDRSAKILTFAELPAAFQEEAKRARAQYVPRSREQGKPPPP